MNNPPFTGKGNVQENGTSGSGGINVQGFNEIARNPYGFVSRLTREIRRQFQIVGSHTEAKNSLIYAYHEAGHALLSIILDQPFDIARIKVNKGTISGEVTYYEEFQSKEPHIRLLFSLGGIVGECFFYGKRLTPIEIMCDKTIFPDLEDIGTAMRQGIDPYLYGQMNPNDLLYLLGDITEEVVHQCQGARIFFVTLGRCLARCGSKIGITEEEMREVVDQMSENGDQSLPTLWPCGQEFWAFVDDLCRQRIARKVQGL